MSHPQDKLGELVHSWRIGTDIVRIEPDEDGCFLGTCVLEGCGSVRSWPAVIYDEKLVSAKKRLTALAEGDEERYE